jgi:nitroreductase
LIAERGSIRRYKDKPIPENDLLNIIEAARLAQSAANRQPWQFIVVTDKEVRERLADAAHWQDRPRQSSVETAGAIIVGLADPEISANWFLVDLGIAIENMALTAWDLGIGSCWIGAFREDDVKAVLTIPKDLRVVSLLTLGYADEKPREKNRKSLEEIIHYNMYGQKSLS